MLENVVHDGGHQDDHDQHWDEVVVVLVDLVVQDGKIVVFDASNFQPDLNS